jgi:hypothetical protein
MASTITIICPECEKSLKAPPDVIGKKIRCKGCGHVFAARAPQGAKKGEKAPKKSEGLLDESEGAYGVTDVYLGARCPFCANAMEEGDVICLHCGYNTVTRQTARMRKVREVTGWDVFLWLLPGIGCALILLTLVIGDLLYITQVNQEDFGDAWYDFIGTKGMKIWISVIVIFFCWISGKFAVRRLIFNYWPPEVEEKIVQ